MNPSEESPRPRVDRREAIKWLFAAAGSALLFDPAARAAVSRPGEIDYSRDPSPYPAYPPTLKGYGQDPDLARDYKPGDLWPLTLSPGQRRCAAALCDLIIPADSESPAASAVGVPDFIDEWVSAPYPVQQGDRPVILEGLDWLDGESRRRFGSDFAGLIEAQQAAIADDICHPAKAPGGLKKAAAFFGLFRDLTTAAFYTSPEGMRDLKYIGNVPLASFEGPSAEVRRRLGLEP